MGCWKNFGVLFSEKCGKLKRKLKIIKFFPKGDVHIGEGKGLKAD